MTQDEKDEQLKVLADIHQKEIDELTEEIRTLQDQAYLASLHQDNLLKTMEQLRKKYFDKADINDVTNATVLADALKLYLVDLIFRQEK